jgi:hypothetical protein
MEEFTVTETTYPVLFARFAVHDLDRVRKVRRMKVPPVLLQALFGGVRFGTISQDAREPPTEAFELSPALLGEVDGQ